MVEGNIREEIPKNEIFYSQLAHFGFLIGLILPPLLSFIIPLLILVLVDKKTSFIERNVINIINFGISVIIYLFIIIPCFAYLMFVNTFLVIGFLFTIPLIIVLGLITFSVFICPIIAIIENEKGKVYKYPFSLKFIKIREE